MNFLRGTTLLIVILILTPGGAPAHAMPPGSWFVELAADRAGQNTPQGGTVPWTVQEPGFIVEPFATGFQLPVNIAFVPDPGSAPGAPFLYVTELYGKIKTVTRSGAVSDYATGLLNFDPTGNFPGSGEQGVTGIAVDPATGDVYASMLYDSAISPGTHYPKVARFTSSDGGRTAATQTTILDMPTAPQGSAHQISALTFGPDAKLYVHMGDGYQVPFARLLISFLGKILRVNPDGTAATDNPFYNAADGITSEDYVWAYGFRNPFGGAWRNADGALYTAENGPSVDRLAKVVGGRDYLWGGQNSHMETFAIYNWDPAHSPVNIAFVELATFGGSGFPVDKRDHAFVSESGPTYATGPQVKGKRITELVLGTAEDLLGGPTPFLEYTGTGKATVVALAAGQDGLYFSDLFKDLNYSAASDPGSVIWRVRSEIPPLSQMSMSANALSWNTQSATVDYDVLRGDLALLRSSGGDFSQATELCVEENTAATTATHAHVPASGTGVWYLVRGLDVNGAGTYESGGPRQTGLRDSEIATSASGCF